MNLIKKFKNIQITCSKTGKMNNNLINEWSKSLIDYCSQIKQNSQQKLNVLLLLDSFSGHWNTGFHVSNSDSTVEIHREKIPPGTTGGAQPIDTYFNHDLKYFSKTFTERLMIDEIEIDIKDRSTIIRMFSLLWNQLSSPEFT
jgi:hypothetical protein